MKLFKLIETSFDNFDNTIRTYLSKMLGSVGKNFSNSQIFGSVFQGIKGVMQNIMFYIEDAFTEQNVNTAYRKSSIYSLAKISGYEPYYGSAASGTINIEISNVNSSSLDTNKLFIKNGSYIIDNNTGLPYSLSLPNDYLIIDLDKPLANYNVKVVQGTWKSSMYLASGKPLETIHINTLTLFDSEYIEVYVDGIKYSSAANMYEMSNNSLEYVISTGYDNELDIMFGNGTYGKQLISGQTIVIKYLTHSGELGNIQIDKITDFQFKDNIYDINGNIIPDTSFINIKLNSSITGGADSDSIEDIRKMIGYNSRSLVIANENNFKLFFKRFSFVGQSNIWTENNSLEVNASCITNFKNTMYTYDNYFNAANDNKLLLNDYQKEMIKTSLNNSNKTFAGISLKFIDPIIYKYALFAYIKVESKYNRDLVNENIKNSIYKYFISLDSNTTAIAKSDLIKYILDENDYIESLDIAFISEVNEEAKKKGFYYAYEKQNINGSIKFVKVKKIYDSTKELGLDEFGNIKLTGKFEIPIMSNNVKYYYNNDLLLLDAVQIMYI